MDRQTDGQTDESNFIGHFPINVKHPIDTWQAFTNIDIKKKRPVVSLTLEGKAHKTVLELNVKEINYKDIAKI